MQSITFECEVITPMFLAGADGSTPELRAPSIKGALRFWWRAMNGHLSLEELKKIEGEIFGSTSQRSKVIIREPQETPQYHHLEYDGISKDAMLPHKDNNKEKSIAQNSLFQIQLMMIRDVNVSISNNRPFNFSFTDLCNLFKVVCTLGGFGKRSRRGFGSVKINRTKTNDNEWVKYSMPTNTTEILGLLPLQYSSNNNGKITPNFNSTERYPHIKSIEIGKTFPNVTREIINASHEVKKNEYVRAEEKAIEANDLDWNTNKPNTKKYSNFEAAIGDGAKRYASPIYVSVLGDTPIITTLNHVPPPNGRTHQSHTTLQNEFKNKLM